MISIVVPIYNVADYLDDCISSILQSTYKDIEVILVDDGSTDESGKICDKYAMLDSRCKVFHAPNGGLSSARNIGIAASTGEFLAFLDGDDFVHPKMYAYLYQALTEHPDADYSMCEYFRASKGMRGQVESCTPYENIKKIVLEQDVIAQRLYGTCADNDFLYLVVWNKLYRRSFIGNTEFIKTGANDVDYNTRLLPKLHKVVLINEKLHYWVQRPTSYVHQGLTKRYVDRVDAYDRLYKMLYSYKPIYADFCLEKFCKIMLNLKRMSKGTDLEEYTKGKLKPYLRLYMIKLIKCSTIPFHRRFAIYFFNCCPSFYRFFIYIMAQRKF